MKYLSLYKTSSEHSADNSRLVPNISLITDEKKMILTNENNIDTTFTKVDIIESFDDIINRLPTGNSTGMPGLKIYGDNSEQSEAKNSKLFYDAKKWRKDYISNNGLNDVGQSIRINVDALMIDNIIMDKYDGNYKYYINIDKFRIELIINDGLNINIARVYSYGLFVFNYYNTFPSPVETRMPFFCIFDSNDKSDNIKLYNNAQQWRKDYISYKGLRDTGQPISMIVDKLYIDGALMDKYNNSYNYHIDIYNDHIILLNNDSEEILTISSDGFVTILDIFNKFPCPTNTATVMPGLKIYTYNTEQSKSNNIKIYNDALQWRKDYISNNDLRDTGQLITMVVDKLIIDGSIIDKSDRHYEYAIDIYNDSIILLKGRYHQYGLEILTIYSDGSVSDISPDFYTTTTPLPFIFNEFPTPSDTLIPGVNIYTDNSYKSKQYNIEFYNNALQWRKDYISYNGWNDTGQRIDINVDALIIDDIIWAEYDNNYLYKINIYDDCIILLNDHENSEVLIISSDGLVFNKFPSLPEVLAFMLGLKIYTDNSDQSNAKNAKLYNRAIQYRKDYLSYNGLSDTGQTIDIYVDTLIIDDETIDEYNDDHIYYIKIYNDCIILFNYYKNSEVLTISSDGLVFNKFPSSSETAMPRLMIYTDNSDESNAKNAQLYNRAQQWLNDTGQTYRILYVDELIINNIIINKYDGNYQSYMWISNVYISVNINNRFKPSLYINRNGSVDVQEYITPTP